jgi:sugar phosphate permease
MSGRCLSLSYAVAHHVPRWMSIPNRILAVLCLMYLVLYIDRVNLATVGPRMTAELGMNNTQFGLATSAFSYPYTLIQLSGGRVIDRFSPRRMLLICGAVVCVATVLTGLVGGMASRFALRLALGVGEGFAFPAATRAMATWLPPARWGFAQGITHAAARLGNALAPPLLVGLMALVSWRGAFVVLGLASAVWVILWLVVARESPERHPGMSDEERAELAPAAWQAAIRPPFRGGGSRGGLRPSRPSISATAGRSGCP